MNWKVLGNGLVAVLVGVLPQILPSLPVPSWAKAVAPAVGAVYAWLTRSPIYNPPPKL